MANVRKVKGIIIGDPVYYKDIRYRITYFYKDRKRCNISKVENTKEGFKTVNGVLIKNLDTIL